MKLIFLDIDFLKALKEPVESFVILDDDSDMEPYMDRLILTHWRDGLAI